MNEESWGRLISQLRAGRCTPVLGPGMSAGILPMEDELARRWSHTYDYPFEDRHDLPRVLQYAAAVTGDPVYVKELLGGELEAVARPDYTRPGEAHAVLADFPLPVVLTTSYHDFLADALRRVGKEPLERVCPWYAGWSRSTDQERLPSVSAESPLVYHVFGNVHTPASLVLTESDYLEFLVAMVRGRAEEDSRLLPEPVLRAISSTPLLFLGFSLHGLAFRVLYQALLRDIPGVHRRRHFAVQVAPPGSPESRLEQPLEGLPVVTYWGTAAEFCAELRARTGGR